MSEDSKNLVGRFWEEVFNNPENPYTVDEIFSPDYRLHNLVFGMKHKLEVAPQASVDEG